MIKQQQHQQPASSVGPQAAAVAAAAAGGCEGRSFANGAMAGWEWNGIVPSWFCYLVPALSSYRVMGLESAFCFPPGRLGGVAAVAEARFSNAF